jgi:NAD(P)-dependent dehydrogenase (short-subunit alcohol dehydrogenase family)
MALARQLAGAGARVAVSDVDGDAARATADRCADARAYRVDVADEAAVHNWAARVAADFGRVDGIVNNAGVALTADVLTMTRADIADVIDIDFWGVVHGSQAFLPHLIASGDGHLVNISSVFGLIGVPSQSAYNAAKFAVRGFTESLRQEMRLAGHPVAVTCVHPGGVRTNVVRNSRALGDYRHAELVERFDRILARTTADAAAATIIRGMRRRRARVLVGFDAYAIDATVRLLGPAYQRVVTAGTRRARIGPPR